MLDLLKKSELAGGVEIHTDLFSDVPTALSRKRAQRLGKPEQSPNKDNKEGADECLFCNPERLKGQPTLDYKVGGKVASFENAAPYMPYDQRVMYLWDDDLRIRKSNLHRFRLEDVRGEELYFLLKCAVEHGMEFAKGPIRTHDLPRMIAGFNLGRLAGQTVPHIHAQYGWDVVVGGETITEQKLSLFYKELEDEQLILHQDERVKIIAPWTPKGQYHLDLHFNKYEIHKLDDEDIKIFAHLGYCILQHYVKGLTIQNVNIVFLNSPLQREIIPVVAQFVPKVNMPALYEIVGVNVVDTPPSDIAAEFRKNINWESELRQSELYDPVKGLEKILKG